MIVFFCDDPATTEIYTLSLHDALPISPVGAARPPRHDRHQVRLRHGAVRRLHRSRERTSRAVLLDAAQRSEEHTSELQSHSDLVCRLLLEKKKQDTSRPKQADTPTTQP